MRQQLLNSTLRKQWHAFAACRVPNRSSRGNKEEKNKYFNIWQVHPPWLFHPTPFPRLLVARLALPSVQHLQYFSLLLWLEI